MAWHVRNKQPVHLRTRCARSGEEKAEAGGAPGGRGGGGNEEDAKGRGELRGGRVGAIPGRAKANGGE